jgi:chromosome segregation ATPase
MSGLDEDAVIESGEREESRDQVESLEEIIDERRGELEDLKHKIDNAGHILMALEEITKKKESALERKAKELQKIEAMKEKHEELAKMAIAEHMAAQTKMLHTSTNPLSNSEYLNAFKENLIELNQTYGSDVEVLREEVKRLETEIAYKKNVNRTLGEDDILARKLKGKQVMLDFLINKINGSNKEIKDLTRVLYHTRNANDTIAESIAKILKKEHDTLDASNIAWNENESNAKLMKDDDWSKVEEREGFINRMLSKVVPSGVQSNSRNKRRDLY